jgi:hypothetical protein
MLLERSHKASKSSKIDLNILKKAPNLPKDLFQTKHFPSVAPKSQATKYKKKSQKVEKTFNFPVFIKIHSVWQMDKTEKMITEIMKEKKI